HVPERTIYSLFKELTNEAEEILNQVADSSTDEEIRKFLKTMKVADIEEDYVKQVKSVIFQDISKSFENTLFEHGWVFSFMFREGKNIRASSRKDDKSAIYGAKVYWNLKELIHKAGKMQECGFFWYLPKEGKESFVQVRIESKSDCFVLDYYYKMRINRKEREEFVLQKIADNLFGKRTE
ncbi:hypothetical protein, partial [Brevibacillus sp. NRS-1366]|uniref:hypothetical protein n=1 Tax=Brevibacillus sp. NRS-1366 TaxID=3233899 RepID=UPI003D1F6035